MNCHRSIRSASSKFAGESPEAWPPRRGAVSLEFLLVFPLVFFATLAIFQFGLMSLAIQCATNAVIEGARVGAAHYPNGTTNAQIADQVAATMNEFLAVHGLEIGGSGTAQIVVERGQNPPHPPLTRGTLPGSFTTVASGPAPSSTEVRVTLCFPLVSTTNPDGYGQPVPDWLSWIGFSLSSYKFQMSSRATLE